MVSTSFYDVGFNYKDLGEAFPDVEPGLRPFGSRVLVQLASAKKITSGGIHLPDEVRETIQWNTQIAKVRFIGLAAFKNRDTLAPWPEGEWAQPGQFVRITKYGGDRWQVPAPDGESAPFAIFNDLDLLGAVADGFNPTMIRAYV